MALHLILDDDELRELAIAEQVDDYRAYWKSPLPAKLAKSTKSPGFAPSTIQARQVESLVALGMAEKDIALALLIDEKLLRFYYKRELDLGTVLINAKVGHVALKMAMSGTDADMTKFWLKTRAGWKETSVVEKTVEIKDVSSARAKLLGPRPAVIDNDSGQITDVDVEQ
jgi:hypothetical protein